MPGAISAYRNPLNTEEALVGYCSAKTNLALEHWGITGGSSTGPYIDNNNTGPIVSPGDLASTRFNNTVAIFGIINYNDSEGVAKKAVSTLSPTLNPVAALSDAIDPGSYQALASTGNEKNKAYVFYLKETSGAKNKPQIHSAALSPSSVTTKSTLDQCHPYVGSRLASVYNVKKDTPVIFFQFGDKSDDTNIQFVNLADGTPNTVDNSTGMGDATPLAATNIKADSNVLTYLYCRNSQSSLTVFIYDANAESWTGPKTLKDAPKLDTASGLSVVADPDHHQNVLYYYQDGDTNFQPWVHDLSSK